MRTLIFLVFLLFTPTNLDKVESSDITVLQINAQWNKENDVNLTGLKGCVIQYGLLERQNSQLKSQIKFVPVIVVYKGSKPIKQWSADLSFRLNVDLQEIQQVINKL